MIADELTIVWKEWKDFVLQRGAGGGFRGGWIGLLMMIGVFGVLLPAESGRVWVESAASLVYWFWVPLFIVSGMVADSFAGERERHTLETLLATRLSDQAILIGKVVAAASYAWSLTLLIVLVGMVTVNLTAGAGELLLYPTAVFVWLPILTLLASSTVACVGVLVSLRASTMRQAVQLLSIAMALLLIVPMFGFQALPEPSRTQLATTVEGLGLSGVLVGVAVTLVVLDAVLLGLAKARFQRHRLILD